MMIWCNKWKININEETECKICEYYKLTDILQDNIIGYECNYEEMK